MVRRSLRLIIFILPVLFLFVNPVVYAAKPPTGDRKASTLVGNDISWPQCGKKLPSGQAFGIVGVNGGLATIPNPCLSDQLLWAQKSIGGTPQPKTQLYVNTANPGEIIDQVKTWPINNIDKTGFDTTVINPYGSCDGQNNEACSWQYGWNRAVEDVVDHFLPAAQKAKLANINPANYIWWLDVETVNTWQSGSAAALARNAATLEGMTHHFQSIGAKVGLYSTDYQWSVIVGGNIGKSGRLARLDSWLAGARSLQGAQANCANPSLTPNGKVTVTQYVSGSYDYDYSCV